MTITIAVLGLGEAGSLIASDLSAAGATVRGFDPAPERSARGIKRCSSAIAAATNADVILSVNSGRSSLEAARSVLPALTPQTLYADLNTSPPSLKLEVAALIAPSAASFADVSLLNPVPGNGVRTPALVSGPGAVRFKTMFSAFGMPIENIGLEVGAAAARKLARSVFYKGLAACVAEALEAGRALGCETWLLENISQTLTAMNAQTVPRLLKGSRLHAARRRDELQAATQMLLELGLTPHMAQATVASLEGLIAEQRFANLEIEPQSLESA